MEFEITFFGKIKSIKKIIQNLTHLLSYQKYIVSFQKLEGKKFTIKKYHNFKKNKINFFTKRKLKISNFLLSDLIDEIESSLELYDISSSSLNKVLIEKEDNLIFILISKFNSHGQGNASVSDIKPSSNSIHLMFKIEPILK